MNKHQKAIMKAAYYAWDISVFPHYSKHTLSSREPEVRKAFKKVAKKVFEYLDANCYVPEPATQALKEQGHCKRDRMLYAELVAMMYRRYLEVDV